MPLRVEWKKKLQTSSERVKSVDIHPIETWVLAALYNGQLVVYDYNSQALIKSIEASSSALRCAKFIARKNWIICGGDDMKIRAYDYLTLERIACFEAHSDYIRSVEVHPTLPLVLTASDDLTIKSWDWDNNWQKVQSFENHAHYVMMVKWSPRDAQLFASASLDRTIKIWSAAAQAAASSSLATVSSPHFTLTGHERGVNSVEYSSSGDKPYLLSASDDCTVRVWDYQTRQCLQVLSGHTKNVCHATFHPYLPIIISASEDGQIRVWNSSTYRHETLLNYDMGRVWEIATLKGSNDIALATDEGTMVVSVGSEKPVASMHAGKILFVKSTEIFACNVRVLDDSNIVDGEKLNLPIKEAGSSAMFPQTISHHPNGRLVAVCGDGEYCVLTAQALRNKAYGQACELVWSPDGSFAVREESGRVRVFADFEEVRTFNPAMEVVEIFGGQLIGVKSKEFICFYEWSTAHFVRRVDCAVTGIYWSENGDHVTITTADEFFILRYDATAVAAAVAAGAVENDEGIEIALEVAYEGTDTVESGLWVGDCFIFVTKSLRLQTFVAGQLETLAFLTRKQFLLGYVPETSRIYLADREVNVTSYKLHLPFLQFQSLLVRGRLEEAKDLLPKIPHELHDRLARFLVHRGMKKLAIEYTTDEDYKFEIALSIGDLALAKQVIVEMENSKKGSQTLRQRWKQLGDTAIQVGALEMASDAFKRCRDVQGLLLLATTIGDGEMLGQVAQMAGEARQENVVFLTNYLLHNHQGCLDTMIKADKFAEANIYARCYFPSALRQTFPQWQESVKTVNPLYASRLVPPFKDDGSPNIENLESQLGLADLVVESEKEVQRLASDYKRWKLLGEYDLLADYNDLGADEIRIILKEGTTEDSPDASELE
eukprot:Blabericola_migrator_1__347@NODE_1088_length_5485_cov_101_249354_g746_i0_p1_GENE_NODE_1088_length_5485_cov_101_249354_g746_i0NODE_1088_length_5485_cov_101_249354_g746_i0_p1_ORF_typecomplete_len887_score139_45Coatomer_WDAD/PF04053_14/23Coatomer_WDAD/PF04053_14/2_8e03Coatomer_WDAD/PF04053_14/1_2e121WD40/PF00400_32/9_5e02WD40/PF00400_32/3_5WD40/PF00400_32/5_6e06WD40/PF00400_32/1_1e06WD40/PF00400_32/4_5e10WD40/PF00400_32/1_3e08WD40/PF00400_32/43WD40/PF00400_32/3_6e02WD40/PF00400_32/1_5e03ANAPC4_WD40